MKLFANVKCYCPCQVLPLPPTVKENSNFFQPPGVSHSSRAMLTHRQSRCQSRWWYLEESGEETLGPFKYFSDYQPLITGRSFLTLALEQPPGNHRLLIGRSRRRMFTFFSCSSSPVRAQDVPFRGIGLWSRRNGHPRLGKLKTQGCRRIWRPANFPLVH